ncbi:MAG TPA: AMP-binding protein [Acidimicrobiales bacterium]|nr:AMP-binding protein [Acidimicrobiales bacterium]
MSITSLPSTRVPLGPLFAADLARHGERVALRTTDEAITYAALDGRVQSVADRLGVGRRLVMITATNTIDFVVNYLGALRGGHVVLLAAGDVAVTASIAERYDPDVVIGPDTAWCIDEQRAATAHDPHPDLALLVSTSGTTGSAKLVRLSSDNLQANAAAIAQYLELTPDDRAMTTLPLQYCYGLSVLNSHMLAGASVVLTELSVVDRCFWDLFAQTSATSFAGVPHTFDLLERVGFEAMSLPTLRYITQAGGRMHPDKVRRFAQLAEGGGWQLFVMYGQTEATARIAYLPPALAASRPGAIGVPVPGGSLTIDSPDGSGVGELVYRGPNVMLGYAEHQADLALGRAVTELRTGDIGRVTPDGLFEIVGRSSRFTKLYGLRIDLDRMEEILARRGVTSMCTAEDEHSVVAAVTSADAAALAQSIVPAEMKVPASAVRVVVLDELPRLANGKPAYLEVRRLAAEQAGHCASREGPPTVSGAFAEVLGVTPGDGDSFVSLGGDSLSYVEMSLRLEASVGDLPRNWHLMPVRDLVARAPAARHRWFARTDSSVVLRAVAIVLVVGTHARLWHLPGGAHTLLVVAGYNFARFQLAAPSMVASIARVAVPSMCWIAVVAALSGKYGWEHALLINGHIGAPESRSGYWFIEALVQILVPLALLLSVPRVRRAERRRPWLFACAVLGLALAIRFDLLLNGDGAANIARPHEVLWLFALGWAASCVTGTRPVIARLALSAVGWFALSGFFNSPSRGLIVFAGLLLVLWVPSLPVPRAATRLVGAVAAASLYIYLSHWQLFPVLERVQGSALAVVGSVVAGIALWSVARRLIALAEARLVPRAP